MNLESFTSREYAVQGNLFRQNYDLKKLILIGEDSRTSLLPKDKRVCRFCGQSMPNTTFKNKAHLIPEFLGNQFLLSNFECDVCNKLFGTYEDQLSKMFGPLRSIFQVAGKTKKPTFKSPGEMVRIESTEFYDKEAVSLTRKDVTDNLFTANLEEGQMELTVHLHPFSLNKVYKCFLKMAYSLLPAETIAADYKHGLYYILHNDMKITAGCRVTGYSVGKNQIFKPHLMLFERKAGSNQVFIHYLILYFLNYIYAVPVPLNLKDLERYSNQINALNYPPLFLCGKNEIENLPIQPFYYDFAPEEPQKGQQQVIEMNFKKEDLQKTVSFNPETKEMNAEAVLNPETLKRIIIMDRENDGFILPLK
ncbi:MAG: endonuclease [Chitinophagaceae bacterium]|nr:endonuclease [Chitinophagaceae bacterium]